MSWGVVTFLGVSKFLIIRVMISTAYHNTCRVGCVDRAEIASIRYSDEQDAVD